MKNWNGPLEKIDDYKWRIPKSYKSGMRVPGIIYTDKNLLESIKNDRALEQVANVSTLPGIVDYSLAMPDIHWGYGFCLTGDANILTGFGYYKRIEDFEKDWCVQKIKSVDLKLLKSIKTSILRFIKLNPKQICRIATKEGDEIKATEDHPFLTPSGMKPVKNLFNKDRIAIYPFVGVPFKKPSSEIIISERDIKQTLLKLKRHPNTPRFESILQKLKKRGLLALTYDHPKLPYILKIMGFVFGDASMNFIGKKGDGILYFSGNPQDLEEARKDLKKIGYTPGPVHFQIWRNPKCKNKHYKRSWFIVNASSLVVLLQTLGVPRGRKVSQIYGIPKWIFKAPLWHKRLFLASLFGCELRTPHRRLNRKGYFNAPVFPMSKREGLIKNGKDFLKDISKLLREFHVATFCINKRKKHINTKGEISWALELIISPKPENLFNLWSKIGFEYNAKRSYIANVAVQYLKLKLGMLKEKEKAIKITIPKLLKRRLSYQKIACQLAGNILNKRFIIDACWKLNKGKKDIIPRISTSFPLFEDYMKEVTDGLGQSGMVWSEIKRMERISYHDFVYDFTVLHSDHNFISNSFVVSNCIGGVAATDIEKGGVISPGGIGFDINCGIRLLKTNLTEKDVKPRAKDLAAALYNNIPAGVGSEGKIRVSVKEERKILKDGSRWAVSNGFGTKEDLEYTEEKGCMEGADPSVVSERAYKRGMKQSGTLGSGNHFVEVQLVDEIYDKNKAEIFGIEKGGITVMIHSGSRGFGYQICDEYSKSMGSALVKYGISVPDRQLACAPVESPEGKAYISAMKCAANYAWNNRQCLMHLVREVFEKFFQSSPKDLGMDLVYDVAHNIAKFEKYTIDGKEKLLCVHRKGATRAFPPGHSDLPLRYTKTGQPVIIPGDMGRFSFLLSGTDKAEETFYSTCHGAGRLLSRTAAISRLQGRSIAGELEKKGIVVMASGRNTLLEEAPDAYKNIVDVVNIVHKAGISKQVARMRPLITIKG